MKGSNGKMETSEGASDDNHGDYINMSSGVESCTMGVKTKRGPRVSV